jgi:hypothetical protein
MEQVPAVRFDQLRVKIKALPRIFSTESGQRLQALNTVIGGLVRISIRLFALFGLEKMNDAFQAAVRTHMAQ